jgi:hypothetical protein
MRFGSTLALAFVLGAAVSTATLAQTSPWPSSSPPAQPAQAAPAATPAKPATTAKPAAAKPAARKPAARPAAAAAAVPAAPALTPEQSGALRFTCSSETKALCQGSAAGSPEAYVCLQGKPDQLSSDCRVSVMAVEEANAVEVDPEAPAMPAAPAPRPRQQPRAQQPR